MEPAPVSSCPCTLAAGFRSYSPTALKMMFNGRKVSHILDFNAPDLDESVAQQLRANSRHISISGAQFKQSLVLDKNRLRLSQPNEAGQYILKPIPYRPAFNHAHDLPANEHLTMQIARQVYKIQTAACGLVFFQNGEPAYLTKRFDYRDDGSKIPQEDFASVLGRSQAMQGPDYKYEGSYEDIASQIRQFSPAYQVERERFFELVLFNFLFSNGDAHLKNFSLQQPFPGDYLLSPAYDLLNTGLHISNETFLALRNGLFSDDSDTESFTVLGYYSYDDFREFGLRIGLQETRLKTLLNKYRQDKPKVAELCQRSWLSEDLKVSYLAMHAERLKMLNTSIGGHLA